MDIRENLGFEPNEVTINSRDFETEKVVEMFDDLAEKYRAALTESHKNQNTKDKTAGIIILSDKSEIDVSTFGSGVDMHRALIKSLISIVKNINADDIAAVFIATAAEMMLEAKKVGNFTFKSILSLSLAKSLFEDLEKAVFKNELK